MTLLYFDWTFISEIFKSLSKNFAGFFWKSEQFTVVIPLCTWCSHLLFQVHWTTFCVIIDFLNNQSWILMLIHLAFGKVNSPGNWKSEQSWPLEKWTVIWKSEQSWQLEKWTVYCCNPFMYVVFTFTNCKSLRGVWAP